MSRRCALADAILITNAIMIEADGAIASVLVAGTSGIIVSAGRTTS